MNSSHFIYGIHAVHALLTNAPQQIKVIYHSYSGQLPPRLQDLLLLAQQQQIEYETVNKESLDRLTSGAVHQGVVAELIPKSHEISLDELLQSLTVPPFLLILDGVQDPHNLGACLRSANAAGVHAVIAPKDRAVNITAVVRKVASGAAEITPFIQVTNLARTLDLLKKQNIWIYGAAEEASETIYQTDLTGPVALVMGGEGAGLRRLTRESCDKLMSIPTVGVVSSLNVSVATGICLFEALRQRIKISI